MLGTVKPIPPFLLSGCRLNFLCAFHQCVASPKTKVLPRNRFPLQSWRVTLLPRQFFMRHSITSICLLEWAFFPLTSLALRLDSVCNSSPRTALFAGGFAIVGNLFLSFALGRSPTGKVRSAITITGSDRRYWQRFRALCFAYPIDVACYTLLSHDVGLV